MNELSVTEEETTRGLLLLGWSHRRISRETGHHRATIGRVSRTMAIAAGGEEPTAATDANAASDLPGSPGRTRTPVEMAAGDETSAEIGRRV